MVPAHLVIARTNYFPLENVTARASELAPVVLRYGAFTAIVAGMAFSGPLSFTAVSLFSGLSAGAIIYNYCSLSCLLFREEGPSDLQVLFNEWDIYEQKADSVVRTAAKSVFVVSAIFAGLMVGTFVSHSAFVLYAAQAGGGALVSLPGLSSLSFLLAFSRSLIHFLKERAAFLNQGYETQIAEYKTELVRVLKEMGRPNENFQEDERLLFIGEKLAVFLGNYQVFDSARSFVDVPELWEGMPNYLSDETLALYPDIFKILPAHKMEAVATLRTRYFVAKETLRLIKESVELQGSDLQMQFLTQRLANIKRTICPEGAPKDKVAATQELCLSIDSLLQKLRVMEKSRWTNAARVVDYLFQVTLSGSVMVAQMCRQPISTALGFSSKLFFDFEELHALDRSSSHAIHQNFTEVMRTVFTKVSRLRIALFLGPLGGFIEGRSHAEMALFYGRQLRGAVGF